MVNDPIGGQFANNLRRRFGMPDAAPAEPRRDSASPGALRTLSREDGTIEPQRSDVTCSESE